MLVNINWSVF